MQSLQNKEQPVYAGFFTRLAAFLIDSLLVGLVLLCIRVPFGILRLTAEDLFLFRPVLFTFNVLDIFYYLLHLGYFVLMTYYCSATVGKYLMKLKVVDVKGEKLSFMSVLVRESVGKYLSAFIVYIGYLMAGIDSRKQGLHDKIADTCVIYR